MIDAVRRYDGYVVQSTGDGVFAMFGAPVAHEDHPQRALYAALRMQRSYSLWRQAAADDRAPIEIRVGVNTGEVVVRSIATAGRRSNTRTIGHTTKPASGCQTVAAVVSIAVTEATRKLSRRLLHPKAARRDQIQRGHGPVNVYARVGDGRSVGISSLPRGGADEVIGRDFELKQMKRALERATAGQGQLIAVWLSLAPESRGCSTEFKATLPVRIKLLEAYSVSHGKSYAYLPVLALLCHISVSKKATTKPNGARRFRAGQCARPGTERGAAYLLGLLVYRTVPIRQMDPR